jgi:hypothetical protein
MAVGDALGELLEEPPPHAARITAAMTAVQAPARKSLGFIALSLPAKEEKLSPFNLPHTIGVFPLVR